MFKKYLAYTAILQLFAYDPSAQPANNTTAEALAPENKTYYDKQLIRYAQEKLAHMQFGQERDIPERAGQTIEFRAFDSLGKALEPLIEGVTPDPQNLSVTAITATVQQYGGFIAYTDKLVLTAIDPMITETVRLIGDQAGLTLDTVTRDKLHADITNIGYASRWNGDTETETFYRHMLDGTAKLTVKEVEKQVTELRSQNAPTIDGYYICIAHPKALFDLKRDPEWRDAQKYTANVKKLFTGEVGEIGGVRFVATTEAKIFRGANLGNGNVRNLSVTANAAKDATSVSVGNAPDAHALKGRYVIIGNTRYAVTDNTGSTITLSSGLTEAVSAGAVVYPGEGGAGGIAVFGCLFFGADAYGKTRVSGGGLKTIIKQLGSAGTADPLDQRATIGWKALQTAKVLVQRYIRRLEVGGTYATADLAAN